MSKVDDYYYIPSGMTPDVCNIIKETFKNETLNDSKIFGSKDKRNIQNPQNFEYPGEFDPKIRSSKQLWIPTDHWISGMMSHFIQCANNSYFNYDLIQWSDRIQYTVYDGKDSHYSWHKDSIQSPYLHKGIELIRKLSISLCLSSEDDYEGGEFQLMHGHRDMKTIKFNIGDVIVFSSDAVHRVRPLKSGKRISLVGWFAGPKFK